MLVDIVKDIIASRDDIEVAGEVANGTSLVRAAANARVDVVILGRSAGADTDDYEAILYSRPRLKILAITDDGRRGVLHEMAPHVVPLGELSPAGLIDAILLASPSHVAGSGQ